jgi:hypothetical protein
MAAIKTKDTGHKKRFLFAGQVSTEFILMFAIALIVLTVFLLLSQEQASDVNKAKMRSDSSNTVSDLAAAAKEVYAQGPGAKKQVLVKIPSGYDIDKSYVANKTIKIRVAGSDYLESVDFDVRGNLPSTSGTYLLWVISEGSRVTIGNMMLSLSKVSISLLMERNQTKSTSVGVTNVWNKPINVSLAVNWVTTNVSLTTAPTAFELGVQESRTVNLTFVADPKAVGYYTGDIVATGNDGSTQETARLPMTIEVIGFGVGIPPALRITPNLLNASMQPNATVIRTFTLCTNAYTSLTDINPVPSIGDPGNWIGVPSSLGSLGADDCTNVNVNVTVPIDATQNIYSGYVIFTGQGMDDPVQDVLAVTINVGGAADDVWGPEVTSVGKTPVRSLEDDDIIFFAAADDRTTGNSSIKKCEINIDGGGWYLMNAVDGTYNSPVENVTYTFIGGLDFGVHTANIRCTDSRNNVGPTRAYQFKVMRPILFITNSWLWTWDEWDWITWLWIHESLWGYEWNFDTYSVSQVTGGSVDINMYASVMMCVYGQSSPISPTLIDYERTGGSVLLVGSALQHGPKALGLTSDTGSGYSSEQVNIIDNTHFITTGYSTGLRTIMTQNTPIYRINNFIGTQLALSVQGTNQTAMGYSSRFILWGPTKPYRFVSDGITLTTRTIDYAIMSSTKE